MIIQLNVSTFIFIDKISAVCECIVLVRKSIFNYFYCLHLGLTCNFSGQTTSELENRAHDYLLNFRVSVARLCDDLTGYLLLFFLSVCFATMIFKTMRVFCESSCLACCHTKHWKCSFSLLCFSDRLLHIFWLFSSQHAFKIELRLTFISFADFAFHPIGRANRIYWLLITPSYMLIMAEWLTLCLIALLTLSIGHDIVWKLNRFLFFFSLQFMELIDTNCCEIQYFSVDDFYFAS